MASEMTLYRIWNLFPQELTMVFMSCNLMGGMFQRLEKLKKHGFASAMLFGENNNSSISSIWVFKGQDLAFELSDDWQIDYASYAWKKMDPKVLNHFLRDRSYFDMYRSDIVMYRASFYYRSGFYF